MASVFLPQELILELFAVTKRGFVYRGPYLLQGEDVVSNIGRQHGGATTADWQYLRAICGIASDIKVR
jgi:hypothetical protein